MGRKKKGTNTGIPGVSFSLNKALGISNAKRKIARATGIPTTRSGRQRKLGKALGCSVVIVFLLASSILSSAVILLVYF